MRQTGLIDTIEVQVALSCLRGITHGSSNVRPKSPDQLNQRLARSRKIPLFQK